MAFCHSLIVKNSAPCDIPRIAPIKNGDFTVDILGLTTHAWLNLVALTTGFLTNEILMKNSNFMGSPYENVMKWTHDIFIAL